MLIENIGFAYSEKKVFDSLNLFAPEHSITAILGPSGCGKTTLLKIISGQNKPFCGRITPKYDSIGYIFQEPTLLSHLNVKNNVEFVLKSVIKDKEKRKAIVKMMLEKVALIDAAEKYPSQLSGGMAQRVSLARAFAYPSELLLMDEPFKGLDFALKKKIISLFCELYEEEKRTTIFVTHDIDEAIKLADKIYVINGDNVLYEVELDMPRENRSIASFSEVRKSLYEVLSTLSLDYSLLLK